MKQSSILKTQRLTLRKFVSADARQAFDNWCGDEQVCKYVTWSPHESVEVTKKLVDGWVNAYDDENTVRYVIVEDASGQLIGSIDVVNYRDGMPEIGYCSGSKFWGKGYMTEALTVFLSELSRLGFERAVIRAVIDNFGSNRVILKCGGKFMFTEPYFCKKDGSTQTLNVYIVDLSRLKTNAFDVKGLFAATVRKNADIMRGYFLPNALIRWHNTGEVFSLERYLHENCEYAGEWSGEIERIETSGDKIITAARVFSVDGELSHHVVSFYLIENGKVAALDEYWGEDGEPPEDRTDN